MTDLAVGQSYILYPGIAQKRIHIRGIIDQQYIYRYYEGNVCIYNALSFEFAQWMIDHGVIIVNGVRVD